MSTCPPYSYLLVMPHLHVQNANAVSSALTHGFPSITAFLGLTWALERKTRDAGIDLAFNAVGVVCHDHQEQVTEDGFIKSFRLTRNPVGKDGGTAAIVEEGRIHLELSLVLALHSEHWHDEARRDVETAAIANLLAGMRVAGGSIRPPAQPGRLRYRPQVFAMTGTEEQRAEVFRKARSRLLPGFALVARDDLLDTRQAELPDETPKASRLNTWLSLSRINWRYDADTEGGKGAWRNDRKGGGWLVPIPVGYGALGELRPAGQVMRARDATTPFRFVESLYSVGEWISPHRLQAPEQLLWYPESRPDQGLYRCRNDYRPAAAALLPLHELN